MNKSDLLLLLQDVGDDDEIYFMYPSGDYWHDTIVKPVQCLDILNCSWSAYHDNYALDDQDNLPEDTEIFWVIS